MKKIKVNLKNRSYNICVGINLLNNIDKLINKNLHKRPILVVTNKKIRKLHSPNLLKGLKKMSKDISFCEVPDSEKAKSLIYYKKLLIKLQEIGKGINPLVIAFGGGVIGDLAGFAAATYRRGVAVVQVPTTLLAQVDSSIGGKVAIDMPQAKNIVGSFYQPKAVIADISVLKTLPKTEILNGLGEIIKYGVIKDLVLFNYIQKNIKKIHSKDENVMTYIVSRCAKIKADVVSKDEFDKNDIRIILNLGHTFAHAIESAFEYSKENSHGQSVGIGMVLASLTALKLKVISKKTHLQIVDLIKHSGLPTSIKKGSTQKILKFIKYDKKFVGGKTRYVLPVKIGKVKVFENIPAKVIKEIVKNGGL